jgi:antitoxin (DNA-binding transcriptional repressor) of toxin-antitoxin stability system
MSLVNIHAAKTQLSRLVAAAAAGEEIIVARLVPLAPQSERRRLGILAGQLKVPTNFDAPLSDEELDRFEAP